MSIPRESSSVLSSRSTSCPARSDRMARKRGIKAGALEFSAAYFNRCNSAGKIARESLAR